VGSSFVTAAFAEHASIVLGRTSTLRVSSTLVDQASGADQDGDVTMLVFSFQILQQCSHEGDLHDATEQDKDARHPGAGGVPAGTQY